jgi:recombinational DNA repair protein RecT
METEKKEKGEMLVMTAEKIAQMTDYKPQEIAVLKNTIGKTLSDTELAYFLSFSRSVDLNPFLHETWAYRDSKGNLIVFAGKDGFLKKAQNHPRFDGITSAAVCANDTCTIDIPNGKVTHTFNVKDRGEVIGAYAKVIMKGIDVPTLVWIDRKEYDKKWNAWSSNPSAMCEKVAITQACKKACGISGLQSEYDFEIKGNVAIPIQDVKAESETEANKKKIIEALATYEGEDKEEIKAMCIEKSQANEFTPEFAQSIANQISLEL